MNGLKLNSKLKKVIEVVLVYVPIGFVFGQLLVTIQEDYFTFKFFLDSILSNYLLTNPSFLVFWLHIPFSIYILINKLKPLKQIVSYWVFLLIIMIGAILVEASSMKNSNKVSINTSTKVSGELDQTLKDALIRGHIKACTPTMLNQIINIDLQINSKEVEAYCGCLAHSYFDDFTKDEHDYTIQKGTLPERVIQQREDIQDHCSTFLVPREEIGSEAITLKILPQDARPISDELLRERRIESAIRNDNLNLKAGNKYTLPDGKTMTLNYDVVTEADKTEFYNTLSAAYPDYYEPYKRKSPEELQSIEEAKKDYDRILNSCLYEKLKDSGPLETRQSRLLEHTASEVCKSIALNPSWLDNWKYN